MPYLYAIVRLLGGWRAAAFACLAMLAIGYAGVQSLRLDAAHKAAHEAALAAKAARNDAVMAELSAIEAARAKEQERADSVNRIAAAYERGKKDAAEQGKQVAADLAAGNERLRDLWQGCKASRVPGPAANPGEPDAADGLRAASAGRIVGAVAACQAQRDALIDALEDDRK